MKRIDVGCSIVDKRAAAAAAAGSLDEQTGSTADTAAAAAAGRRRASVGREIEVSASQARRYPAGSL